MSVYAETSAVLAWLFGESRQDDVWTTLGSADAVLTSGLMHVEVDRALLRSVHVGDVSERSAGARRRLLRDASERWITLGLTTEVLDAARRPMPIEPVRTLDALHLSSALIARVVRPDLRVLTLDRRIRTNAEALGFDVEPEL